MDSQIEAFAETIWNYHRMNHEVARADAILVLCSHDERVAERGAQLFLEGWAPLLIFSGGNGAITRTLWNEPEAERFARIAERLNVPRESILVEPHSTNTGENITFTKTLLAEQGLNPHKFIVVQKPYMERRSYATFRKFWPEKELIVTSTGKKVSPALLDGHYQCVGADHFFDTAIFHFPTIERWAFGHGRRSPA